MATVRLTKTFTFEMAHALYNYDGKCRNIHGHSYKLEVTIIGQPKAAPGQPDDGLLMDFGDLKKLVNSTVVDVFDHALVMQNNYDQSLTEQLNRHFSRMIYVDYQPTCENLIADFANRIGAALPQHVRLYNLRLHETATAWCEWYADDQPGN